MVVQELLRTVVAIVDVENGYVIHTLHNIKVAKTVDEVVAIVSEYLSQEKPPLQ